MAEAVTEAQAFETLRAAKARFHAALKEAEDAGHGGTTPELSAAQAALMDAYELVDASVPEPGRGAAKRATRPVRAALLTWDCREHPDLGDMGRVITELSEGDTVYLHEVDTRSDFYAIVLATVRLDKEAASAVFRRLWMSDDEDGVIEMDTEVHRG